MIGEITAGILLGPSLLGLVLPEVTAFLFPSSVTGVLGILAQIGLIFFMFLIGLDWTAPRSVARDTRPS